MYVVKRLLQLAPELAWKRNARGMTPLEHIEALLESPDALASLAQALAQNGKRCATKQELQGIAKVLEQAVPTPSL